MQSDLHIAWSIATEHAWKGVKLATALLLLGALLWWAYSKPKGKEGQR